MAKKGSARREPDPDLEDEEVELDSPPKKKSSSLDKSSKTSSTKRKSSEGPSSSKNGTSSIHKKAGAKESGKRKSATSGSRKASSSDDDDGEEVSSSARRRRAGPPAKKNNQNQMVMIISIVSLTLLISVGAIVFNKHRTPPPRKDENVEYEAFKKAYDEGLAAFREFNNAERAGNAALSSAKNREAHEKLGKAMDLITKILDNHRGPDGNTLPEYEGYEPDQQKIAQYLVDLEKRADLNAANGRGGGGGE